MIQLPVKDNVIRMKVSPANFIGGETAAMLWQTAIDSMDRAEIAEKNALEAAERAEQAAITNGYAEFFMKNGRTYLVRTTNITEKLDFEQVSGRLVVKISG